MNDDELFKKMEELHGVWDISSYSRGWHVKLAVQSENSDKFVHANGKTLKEAVLLAIDKVGK